MKRNIFAYADKGHKKMPDKYSLSLEELKDFTTLFYEKTARWGSATSGAYEVIVEAYAAGFEAGTRYEKNRQK